MSEAGPSGARCSAVRGFGAVEIVEVDDLQRLDWEQLPNDGRATVLASNQRARYGEARDTGGRSCTSRYGIRSRCWTSPAPAIVSWGYADGALAAVRAWLEGRAAAPGRAPVPLAPPAPAPSRRKSR